MVAWKWPSSIELQGHEPDREVARAHPGDENPSRVAPPPASSHPGIGVTRRGHAGRRSPRMAAGLRSGPARGGDDQGVRPRGSRSRPRRSATSSWSATAGRARPRWPRPCCTPGAISRRAASRTARPCATSSPRSRAAPCRSALAVAPVRLEGPQDQPDRHARLRRLRGRGARPRCASPTWPCSWSARSTGSRCRPSASGGSRPTLGLPRLIFVNKLDRERADFDRTVDEIRDRFGAGVAPLELPIGQEADVPRRGRPARPTRPTPTTAIGRRTRPARDPRRDGRRRARGARQPRRGHRGGRRRAAGALPRRRGPRRVERARAHAGARRRRRLGVPGGVRLGHDRRRRSTGSPTSSARSARRPSTARRSRSGPATTEVEIAPDPSGDPLAFVFKTIADQYVGQISLFKVLSGTHPPRRPPGRTRRTGADERLHGLFALRGREHHEPPSGGRAGDIVRGRQAHGHRHRRHAGPEGQAGAARADRAGRAGAGRRRVGPHPVRRRQAGQRAAPAVRGGPDAASSTATTRPTRRCCEAWARPTCR